VQGTGRRKRRSCSLKSGAGPGPVLVNRIHSGDLLNIGCVLETHKELVLTKLCIWYYVFLCCPPVLAGCLLPFSYFQVPRRPSGMQSRPQTRHFHIICSFSRSPLGVTTDSNYLFQLSHYVRLLSLNYEIFQKCRNVQVV
jgi:hypothetical protein